MGQCLEAIKRTKLVTVGGAMQNVGKEIEQRLGIGVVEVGFEELSAACQNADGDQARQLAARWKSAARSVLLDDPDATLEQSARLYLAQQAVLEKHQAEAITINCLGGFYGGHLAAYPCLGFVELLDTGLVGACEADLLSTVTMIVMKHLVGRPGFISDPVLDTSKRQIIYAHCVAPTRMFGPASEPNPFEILTHSEDRQGRVGAIVPPAGLHDHDHGDPSRPTGDPAASGQGGGERGDRPRLPHQAGRRDRGRCRETLHVLGPVRLAPRHVLRRPAGAGPGTGRGPEIPVHGRSVSDSTYPFATARLESESSRLSWQTVTTSTCWS